MEKYDFFIEYKEAFAHERYLLAEYFGADVMIVKGVSAKNGAVFAKSGRILTGEDFNLWGGETVFRLKKFDGTAFSEQEEKILAKLPLEITGQQYFLAAAAGGDIPECADAVFGAGSDFVSGDDSGIRGTGSAFIPFDAGWKRRVGRLISLCTAGRLGKSVQRCTLTLTCGDTEIAENAVLSGLVTDAAGEMLADTGIQVSKAVFLSSGDKGKGAVLSLSMDGDAEVPAKGDRVFAVSSHSAAALAAACKDRAFNESRLFAAITDGCGTAGLLSDLKVRVTAFAKASAAEAFFAERDFKLIVSADETISSKAKKLFSDKGFTVVEIGRIGDVAALITKGGEEVLSKTAPLTYYNRDINGDFGGKYNVESALALTAENKNSAAVAAFAAGSTGACRKEFCRAFKNSDAQKYLFATEGAEDDRCFAAYKEGERDVVVNTAAAFFDDTLRARQVAAACVCGLLFKGIKAEDVKLSVSLLGSAEQAAELKEAFAAYNADTVFRECALSHISVTARGYKPCVALVKEKRALKRINPLSDGLPTSGQAIFLPFGDNPEKITEFIADNADKNLFPFGEGVTPKGAAHTLIGLAAAAGKGIYLKPLTAELLIPYGGAVCVAAKKSGAGERIIGEIRERKQLVTDNGIISDSLYLDVSGRHEERVFPTPYYGDETIKTPGYSYSVKSAGTVGTGKPRAVIPCIDGDSLAVAGYLEQAGAKTVNVYAASGDAYAKFAGNAAAAISQAQMLVIAADTDNLRALKAWADFLSSPAVNEEIYELVNRNGLVLGMGGGFRILAGLGLIPDDERFTVKLADNASMRRAFVRADVKVASNKSPWLANAVTGQVYPQIISGRYNSLTFSKEYAEQLMLNGDLATQYADFNLKATMDASFNPAGSDSAAEGLSAFDGRVLALTAVRHDVPELMVCGKDNVNMKIYQAGVKYFR